MALSRPAAMLAREIRLQDWSDAHSRLDGARHNRVSDRKGGEQLPDRGPDFVRTNVMWVVAQALFEDDPNFDVWEFAKACGVADDIRLTSRGTKSGAMIAGLRRVGDLGDPQRQGE